jgi:two-component system chemotaxis response regulator CheB
VKSRLIVIGASLGGIDALCELVKRLPAGFPAPIFIAQHIASHSPGMLPSILMNAGWLPAVHPKSGELIEGGKIYVAPPDRHMLVQKGYIRLSHGPRENRARSAIDALFRSAAVAYGPAVVGAVLSGQLDDGTAGLLAIKDRGGVTIVQEPTEATAASMPLSAIRHVKIDHVCKLAEIASLCVTLANDDAPMDNDREWRKLMEIENHIAEGAFSVDDWWGLEQMSTPSGLNCPSCGSALYELNDKRVLRFRCRSGHAFSAHSLLNGQVDAREARLSSLFGALIEEATLTKRMRSDPKLGEDLRFAKAVESRIESLERETAQVCEWLRAVNDLVDPEPQALIPAD